MPMLLFADDRGRVFDHPGLLAAVRTGDDVVAPAERPVRLPDGATLTMLPGRRPVGVDPATGALVVLREARVGRRPTLPQWAYTAAAFDGGPVAWALHTDRRRHWSPRAHSTPDLPRLVERTLAG